MEVFGTPGSGMSIKAGGSKMIVNDPLPEFIDHPEGSVILNPADERAETWSPQSEV